MSYYPAPLKKKNALYATGGKSGGRRRCSQIGFSGVDIYKKLRQTDELLEKTLADRTNSVPSLTKREEEILRLVISGKTNKEIARKLCRAERTVEYHRNQLMHKLDAHNAAQLVKKAIAMGFLSG